MSVLRTVSSGASDVNEGGALRSAAMANPLRPVTLIVHALLAVPAVALVCVAALAVVLSLTGSNDDPHGFATAIALLGGLVGIAPLAIFTWAVRRWWISRGYVALVVLDIGLLAMALLLIATDYSPGEPWVAGLYAALAAVGIALLLTESRHAESGTRPIA